MDPLERIGPQSPIQTTSPEELERQPLLETASKTDEAGRSVFGLLGSMPSKVVAFIKGFVANIAASKFGQAINQFASQVAQAFIARHKETFSAPFDMVKAFKRANSYKKEIQRHKELGNKEKVLANENLLRKELGKIKEEFYRIPEDEKRKIGLVKEFIRRQETAVVKELWNLEEESESEESPELEIPVEKESFESTETELIDFEEQSLFEDQGVSEKEEPIIKQQPAEIRAQFDQINKQIDKLDPKNQKVKDQLKDDLRALKLDVAGAKRGKQAVLIGLFNLKVLTERMKEGAADAVGPYEAQLKDLSKLLKKLGPFKNRELARLLEKGMEEMQKDLARNKASRLQDQIKAFIGQKNDGLVGAEEISKQKGKYLERLKLLKKHLAPAEYKAIEKQINEIPSITLKEQLDIIARNGAKAAVRTQDQLQRHIAFASALNQSREQLTAWLKKAGLDPIEDQGKAIEVWQKRLADVPEKLKELQSVTDPVKRLMLMQKINTMQEPPTFQDKYNGLVSQWIGAAEKLAPAQLRVINEIKAELKAIVASLSLDTRPMDEVRLTDALQRLMALSE